MKRSALFIGSLVAAVMALALGIFYLVPGPYHPLTFSKTPGSSHLMHAIAFFALYVLLMIVAMVNRPRADVR